MALKQFPYAERGGIFGAQINYPDDVIDGDTLTVDGSLLWDGADRFDTIVAGDYLGGLVLTDFVPPDQFITLVTFAELLGLFTAAEIRKVRDFINGENGESQDDDVLVQWTILLQLRGQIDLLSADVIAVIDQFETTGILTTPRHDAILQGVPL